MLVIAVAFIFSALVLYTVGVWSEKLGGTLRPWHAAVFWAGFACDTIGTGAMGRIAGSILQLNFHGLTGLLAILLMLFHALWATIVLVRGDEARKASFHRLSLLVWCVWLVPMLGGILFGAMS